MCPKGTEKGNGNYPEEEKNKRENARVDGGIVKNLARKTPSGRTKACRNALRMKLNSSAEWTSYFTLRGRRRNRGENYREHPMKTEYMKNLDKTNISPYRRRLRRELVITLICYSLVLVWVHLPNRVCSDG